MIIMSSLPPFLLLHANCVRSAVKLCVNRLGNMHLREPWRITFEFDEGDAFRIDSERHH